MWNDNSNYGEKYMINAGEKFMIKSEKSFLIGRVVNINLKYMTVCDDGKLTVT